MHYFCTYFDKNYLTRGLCLYKSLVRHCTDFRLYALCLDDESYRHVQEFSYEKLIAIAAEELEQADPKLAEAKTNRAKVEYYFTCSPCLPLYLLDRFPKIENITYLDADLYFFSSPEPIFQELEGYSIGIIEHRLPPYRRHQLKNGIYNVGWLTFRNDANGRMCLQWWRDACIEWCGETHREDGKYTDQAYLDDWPERFEKVRTIAHIGANAAPWNIENYAVHYWGGAVWIGDKPLIFYHFHALRRITSWLYHSGFGKLRTKMRLTLRRHVYLPYIEELEEFSRAGLLPERVRNIEARLSLGKRFIRSLCIPLLDIYYGAHVFVVRRPGNAVALGGVVTQQHQKSSMPDS